jgi:hypothetical protein
VQFGEWFLSFGRDDFKMPLAELENKAAANEAESN